MSDYDAWMAASEAPMVTCGVCGDDIIWHGTHKRWEHIGRYDHEADGPPPVKGLPSSGDPTDAAPRDTQALPAYDQDTPCPKCSTVGADTVWRPNTVRISRVIGLVRDRGKKPEPGWMHRTCAQCGYDWAEAPRS